jgi:hypothetical protein
MRRAINSVICVALLIAAAPTARATTPSSTSSYRIVGFTKDGKHVFYRKEITNPHTCDEVWLAIYRVKGSKRLRSSPIYRDPDSCLDNGISRGLGKKLQAKLERKYGHPVRRKGGGKVVLKVTGEYPVLESDYDFKTRARLRLRLTATIGGKTHLLLDKRVRHAPSLHHDEERVVWKAPSLDDWQIGSQGKTVAVVLVGRPRIFSIK